MADWLPWAFLAFVIVLLMAMPWRRPHPNHEFMLHLLRLLESSVVVRVLLKKRSITEMLQLQFIENSRLENDL